MGNKKSISFIDNVNAKNYFNIRFEGEFKFCLSDDRGNKYTKAMPLEIPYLSSVKPEDLEPVINQIRDYAKQKFDEFFNFGSDESGLK